MNKLLIELAIEAKLLNYVDNETPRNYFIDANADIKELQKFAIMILQECEMALNPILRDMISRDKAIRLIKERFGVE